MCPPFEGSLDIAILLSVAITKLSLPLLKNDFLLLCLRLGWTSVLKIEQYLSKTTKQIFKGSNKDSGNQRMVVEFIWDAASTVALTLQALPFHRNQLLLHSFRTFFVYSPASNTRSYSHQTAIF